MYDPNSLVGTILSHCLRLDGWPMRTYLALRKVWIEIKERRGTDEEPRPDAAPGDKAS